jgi:hypothetical protein
VLLVWLVARRFGHTVGGAVAGVCLARAPMALGSNLAPLERLM